MLQDVHCCLGKENIFRNSWGTDIIIEPFRNNAGGVAILTKNVKVNVCESNIDESGNYIIAKVTLNHTLKLILVNIYGHDNDSPNTYEKPGEVCAEMQVGDTSTPMIIAGDLNLALNGDLDTMNYVRENNTRA